MVASHTLTVLVAAAVSGAALGVPTPSPAPPVRVDLYYEALCGGCRDFFTGQLYPTYQSLSAVMDVHLYAYGNAHHSNNTDGSVSFECQHGKKECYANMMTTCFQHFNSDKDTEMNFVNCVESSDDSSTAGKKCVESESSLQWSVIDGCINSSLGQQLEYAVAVDTDNLQPSHKYTPWILINGVWSDAQNTDCMIDMKKVVCETYTGPEPAACKSQ